MAVRTLRLDTEARTNLPVVVFGRQAELSMAVLKAVARTYRVVAVVESQVRGYKPPKAWQRWLSRPAASRDIERFAHKHGIPFFVMTPERMDALAAFIGRVQPRVGVIAKMVQLLPTEIVALFPLGIINIHPSLLPLYRGPIPVFWTLFNQEIISGLTVHLIDRGEDTGDIIIQKELPLAFGESAEEFGHRCAVESPALVLEALDQLARGTAVPRSQRMLPCPFRARFLRPNEDPINWADWPVERIYQALRAAESIVDLLPPRPFPWSFCEWRVVRFDRSPGADPGRKIVIGFPRCYIPLRDGRIFLRPRFSLWQLRCGLKDLVSKRRVL